MKNEIEYKGETIKIIQDEDVQSPSEWADTNLFLVANHRDFYVPEPGEKSVPNDPDDLCSPYRKTHWIFPLEAYIHSGVRLAFGRQGNFPDRRWDVSQLGFVFVSKKEWRLSKSAEKAAASLIAEWNTYLSGDVWGYVVADGTPFEESCWGHYGYDYCVDQAKSIVDYVIQRKAKEQDSQHEAACRDIVTA